MKNRFFRYVYLAWAAGFFLIPFTFARAQPALVKKAGYTLKIPNIITMSSSTTHFYVLSSSEGLVVFRAYQDSLEWLYTSPDMQQRGNTILSDVRFAYLFGKGRRLTVLEPTSVLGVYSSTTLPAPVRDVHRLGYDLYLAMGDLGIGKLSLKTPEAVDGSLTFIIPKTTMGARPSIIDLEGTSSRLLALGNNHVIYTYASDKGNLVPERQIRVGNDINHIFLIDNELLGSTPDGRVYGIRQNGGTTDYFSVKEPVGSISKWKDWYVVRTRSGKLWLANSNHEAFPARTDTGAGNHFVINKSRLWINEYDNIYQANVQDNSPLAAASSDTAGLQLKPIPDMVVPFPHPVILSLGTKGNYPAGKLTFNYRSHVTDAKIKGEGFYWQPAASDIGLHSFTIIATSNDGQVDSTRFNVQIQTFNEPPRFSPVHPQSVPAGRPYQLQFIAIDPDGQNPHLVRYLGVNLPSGAQLDEKTGLFTWTPADRQIGKNSFEIIATDQYGAASSLPVELTVVNVFGEEQQ